jgi:hypothetical protein
VHYCHAFLTPISLAMWSTSMLDTDKTMQMFFDGCADAGPEGCGFYEPSAANISSRLSKLFDAVHARPVPVINGDEYGVIDYSFLRSIVFLSLYFPYRFFEPLAEALASLEAGDGNKLSKFLPQYAAIPECLPKPYYSTSPDAGLAIICTDGDKVRDSPQEFASYYRDLLKSSSFAELVANIRLGCSYVFQCNRFSEDRSFLTMSRCRGWQVEVSDRFKGSAYVSFSRYVVDCSSGYD